MGRLRKLGAILMLACCACLFSGCAGAEKVVAYAIGVTIESLIKLIVKAIGKSHSETEPRKPKEPSVARGPEQGLMINNQKFGVFQSSWSNGRPASYGLHVSDVRHGKWLEWWPNGRLCSEGAYLHGRMVGHWQVFDEQGNLLANTDLGK